MFNVGDTVTVLDNAFPGSDDLRDKKLRGQRGTVTCRLWEVNELGTGWEGCYEVTMFDDGYPANLTEDEISLEGAGA